MDNIKNPIFIKNSTDPISGNFVKEIRVMKVMKDTEHKKNRIKYDMVWQYYRDRNRKSIEEIYKEHKGKQIKIIYFGDSIIHELECPNIKLLTKQKNDNQSEQLNNT